MYIKKKLVGFFINFGLIASIISFPAEGMDNSLKREGNFNTEETISALSRSFSCARIFPETGQDEKYKEIYIENASFSFLTPKSISEKLRLASQAEEREQDEEAIKHYNEAVQIKKISKTQKARIYYGRAGLYKKQALKQQGGRKKILLDQAYQDYHVTLLHLEMAETRSPTLPSIDIIENEMLLISSLKSAE